MSTAGRGARLRRWMRSTRSRFVLLFALIQLLLSCGLLAVVAYQLNQSLGRLSIGEQAIRVTIGDALFAALIVVLPLALTGATVAMRVIDGRIARINRTASGIAAGDLARRVPLDGSADSFDQLGTNINEMLGRIEALVMELRTLSDSLAHDLRSPITRLRARIDRALAGQEPQGHRAALLGVRREADALLAMLTAAIEIAQAEAGVGRERIAPLDLAALVSDLAELYEPLVEEAGRTLGVDAPAPLVAEVHRELIGQALSNLVDNSIKYGDGAICLSCRREDRHAVIEVADQGPGIAEPDRATALARFGRLDRARSREGAGLGLSLVAALARLHGGRLRMRGGAGDFAVQLLLPLRQGLGAPAADV